MSTYRTDDEQVEAIKSWWRENGKSIVGGIALGLAVIVGWQWWQKHTQVQGETASILFDNMTQAAERGDSAQALADGQQLIADFANTAYASFAALELARIAYQKSEKSAARSHLQWVLDAAPDPAIAELARLRLAQLLLDIEDLAALEALLDKEPLPGFAPDFTELRGDLALAQGDRDKARDAYRDALLAGASDPGMLRMKLIDIGGEPPAS
jgi:predicted negative regulator of RcsB-dependent stress response